jgi:hypothetical protein
VKRDCALDLGIGRGFPPEFGPFEHVLGHDERKRLGLLPIANLHPLPTERSVGGDNMEVNRGTKLLSTSTVFIALGTTRKSEVENDVSIQRD